MLAMIMSNVVVQPLVVLGQYKSKSWTFKLREALILLMFLRPAVDAYRVSTHYEDTNNAMDSLQEMVYNKGIELGTESIPGCVLQLYVGERSLARSEATSRSNTRRGLLGPFEHPEGATTWCEV